MKLARLITPRKRRRLQELLRLSQVGMPSIEAGERQEAQPTSRSTEELKAHDLDAGFNAAESQKAEGMLYNCVLRYKGLQSN
jgi:hypothetical protein